MKNKVKGKKYEVYYDGSVYLLDGTYVKKIEHTGILDFLFDGGVPSKVRVDLTAEQSEEETLEHIREDSIPLSWKGNEQFCKHKWIGFKYVVKNDEMMLKDLICVRCGEKKAMPLV